MGIWQKAKAIFSNATVITESAQLEKVFRELYGNGGTSAAGVSVNPTSAMQAAAVYACVRVLSESVAQLPRPIYKRREDGGKDRQKEHWLYRLLNIKPNPWQTGFEFFEMMMGHLCLRGKAFAFKNLNSRTGQTTELIPLHPDCMEVKQNPDYTLAYRYSPMNGSAPVDLRYEQVFSVRGLSSDGVNALSPIGMARNTIGLALATDRHGAALFKNGAQLKGMIKHPGELKEKARQNLRESFDRVYAGADNAFKTFILDEGMDYVAVGMTAEDSQFIETRKYQRNEIASIFRVPPHKIGDLERATFSNIEHQALEFVTDTLLPWLRRWEEAITRDLIPEKEQSEFFMEFLVDGLLRGDIKTRYQAYQSGILSGWINRNEVRIKENLNPVAGLDEFLTPTNMSLGSVPDNGDDPPEKQKQN